MITQQPPWDLNISLGESIEGDALCAYLEKFWGERQTHDRELLVFEGSSESELDINRSCSTHATLFATGPYDEDVVFTCHIDIYVIILHHVYGIREPK